MKRLQFLIILSCEFLLLNIINSEFFIKSNFKEKLCSCQNSNLRENKTLIKALNATVKTVKKGAKIKIVILWTQIRSGSRFTGKVLSSNFHSFYNEEPIRELYESKTKNIMSIDHGTFLQDILLCKFKLYPEYYKYRSQYIHFQTKDSQRIYYDILKYSNLTESFEESLCNSSKFRIARIVLSNFKILEKLLLDQTIDTKIVFLVRDPRAVLKSRDEIDSVYGKNEILSYHPCVKLKQDLFWARYMIAKGLNKIMFVRYEDIALNPTKSFKKIFHFTGLPYTYETHAYIKAKTMVESRPGNPFETNRRSEERAVRWRFISSFDEIKKIQSQCGEVMKELGYRVFSSEKEYKNETFNVLL